MTEVCASCGGAFPCPSGHPWKTVTEEPVPVPEENEPDTLEETRGGENLADLIVAEPPSGIVREATPEETDRLIRPAAYENKQEDGK